MSLLTPTSDSRPLSSTPAPARPVSGPVFIALALVLAALGVSLGMQSAGAQAVDEGVVTVVVGHTVVREWTATNEGPLPLIPISERVRGCDGEPGRTGDGATPGALDPGETWTYLCTYVATGNMRLVLELIMSDAEGTEFDFGQSVKVETIASNLDVAALQPPRKIRAGDSLEFQYEAQNFGRDPISSVVVTDVCGELQVSDGDDGDGKLEKGEVWLFSCAVTPAAGVLENDWKARGTTILGTTLSAAGRRTVDVIDGHLDLTASTDDPVVPGERFILRVEVSNPGNDHVRRIRVESDACSPLAGPFGAADDDSPYSLDPGEVWSYSCTAVARDVIEPFGIAATAIDRLQEEVAVDMALVFDDGGLGAATAAESRDRTDRGEVAAPVFGGVRAPDDNGLDGIALALVIAAGAALLITLGVFRYRRSRFT
ncbi:MAG: hypothetical protein GY929_20075 [Actinomycetia bacterium]|nr:hypothetical protein [Actinomycetes bacterium]